MSSFGTSAPAKDAYEHFGITAEAIVEAAKDYLEGLKLYPARCHWTCAEPGWEEVADYALDWALRYARPSTVQESKITG